MTILVTGASGHVGVNLVKVLAARGYHVRALIHDNSLPPDWINTEVVRGDVCDLDSILRACENIEVVYHLAARISIGADNWATLEKINVTATRNMVEACLSSGASRLVHFSSIHAMVQEPFDMPVDESRPLVKSKHHPCYDRSKAAGEEEVHKGIERGLDAVIINPTGIIGPNDFQSSYFGEAFLAMANGKLPALVRGGFDWVDVRDVAEGAILAEEKAPPGSKYLLSGHWAAVQDMAVMISEITGVSCPRFVCPMWLASGVAPVAENLARLTKRQSLFTGDSMRALRTCNHHISHEKATRELGYNPRPLRETIEDTLRWYAENGKLKWAQQADGRQK
jgi:dihydroflavonol-4-reductase